MSEDEDCDELPPISVNFWERKSSKFTMPTAEALASQRARELHIERELSQLRETDAPTLVHSDSSGSEGEALLAAVDAMRVRQARVQAPLADELLHALAHAAPSAASDILRAHADVMHAADRQLRSAHLDNAVWRLAVLVHADVRTAWPDTEALCAGALLCAGGAARESCTRRTAARALQQLLDYVASPAQVCELSEMLMKAVQTTDARLTLSDAVRSGEGGAADRVAARLLHGVLGDLLGVVEATPLSEARLAELVGGAARQSHGATLVAALGRALAARVDPDAAARAHLLCALAPPTRRERQPQPDKLEMLVGATKLRLLFRADSVDAVDTDVR